MTTSFHPTITRLRAFLLASALLGVLAATSITVDAAGAASSGGIGSPGSEAGDTDKYALIWEKTSRRDKRWARKTAECESGRDPNAIGGGGQYRGAFQFLKATWKSSPKSPGGDPIDHPYRTQAVVAVALKDRDGAGHWPVCG